METKVLIYCLYDPIECKIRYIGRTTKKVLDHRLIEHITKSRYHNRYYPGKKATHKVNWINFLIKEGREPKIKKLCEVIGWKESHIFERDLIKKYDEKRDLTNADDRGIGHKNKIITDEQKIQISNTLKKFYETKLNPRAKCIEVYDLNGKFLETYESATEFAKILNIVHCPKLGP